MSRHDEVEYYALLFVEKGYYYSMERVKILVVEDDPGIASVVQTYLMHEGWDVRIAVDGKDAIGQFELYSPHLVILDRMLPHVTGEEVFKWIKKRSATPVIMVTAKGEERDILEGFTLGTDDYVTKPFSPKVLIARCKSLLRRVDVPQFRDKIVTDTVIIDPETSTISARDVVVSLSAKEFDILYLMAHSPERIFSRAMIVDYAFNGDYEGYERSIDSHIKNIRKKLDVFSPQQFVHTVYGQGYMFKYEKA